MTEVEKCALWALRQALRSSEVRLHLTMAFAATDVGRRHSHQEMEIARSGERDYDPYRVADANEKAVLDGLNSLLTEKEQTPVKTGSEFCSL